MQLTCLPLAPSNGCRLTGVRGDEAQPKLEQASYLSDPRSCEHASYPVHEALLPGRVKAPEASTGLCKVVLLCNAHLLTVARHLHVLVGVLL